MASSEALKILRELQSQPDNRVRSTFSFIVLFYDVSLPAAAVKTEFARRAGVCGLCDEEPAVGECQLWDLYVPGVQRQAQGAGSAPQLRAVRFDSGRLGLESPSRQDCWRQPCATVHLSITCLHALLCLLVRLELPAYFWG